MPRRFVFRMTHYQNLQIYFADGRLYAKNHTNVQNGWRISYEDIVARRGTPEFTTPCGSNVNDFVPFYFSPITKMAYTIHAGNVKLRNPADVTVGTATMDDVAYIVAEPPTLFATGQACWFTDIGCNSGIPPVYSNDPTMLDTHIDWPLFDDTPRTAYIRDIGYDGVCRWQHDRDTPVEHQQRSKKRMAEFMIRDYLNVSDITCIVLKNASHQGEVQTWIDESGVGIPVYVNSSCYF